MNKINVLSLFDGMSCGQIALERAGFNINSYYASEIDKYAIKVTMANYPNTIQLGDVNDYEEWNLPKIDLLIGGSPCTNLSICGDRTGLKGEQSKLFYKYLEILKLIKPKYFLLENVASMSKENKNIISELLGCNSIMIDSSLLSAQTRKRLYWTNIPNIEQPKDKGLLLKDVLEYGVTDRDKSYCIDANYFKGGNLKQYFKNSRRQLIFENKKILCELKNNYVQYDLNGNNNKSQDQRAYYLNGKHETLTSSGCGSKVKVTNLKNIRKLTPLEVERLQTVPDNYTLVNEHDKQIISNSQRYKMLGNGFTVDVISHILSHMEI